MKRLSGLDASFLYTETRPVHMHTLKVAIIDAPDDGDPDLFSRFKAELAARLHLLPLFRSRAVSVPLGIDHPVWVSDPAFDLDCHVHHRTLAMPGGPTQMDAVIAEIAGIGLDRSRPLWEIWMLEGLQDSQIAFVAKLHHSLADGMASAELLANVMSSRPNEPAAPDPDAEAPRPPLPSPCRLVIDALVDQPRRVAALPRVCARTARGLASVISRLGGTSSRAPRPFDAPRTSFNSSIGPRRTFATTTLSIADLRAIGHAHSVTLNDVFLAIVSGALRRYLADRGEVLDRSLLATVPVAVHIDAGEQRLHGNRLSNLFTSLCTDVDDPIDRLRAIHDTMALAKQAHGDLGPDVLQDWTSYAHSGALSIAAALYSRLGGARYHRPPANLVVSNVRGPDLPLYIAGSRLRRLYSVGPVLEGIGLNLTAWSYAGELGVATLACRDLVPDAHMITDRLHESLRELLEPGQLRGVAEPRGPRDLGDSGRACTTGSDTPASSF